MKEQKVQMIDVNARSKPEDYWKSRSFVRRYVINNINGIHVNEEAKQYDIMTFMAQAQGIAYLNESPTRLLDAGCGHAMRAARLAGHFKAKAWGVDYSEHMITEARNIMQALPEQQRVELLQADVENLPFENEDFDIAVTYGLFMSLPNAEKAASELLRVTRNGLVLIEETDRCMDERQLAEWTRVKDKQFPGRIYWHDYLKLFGRCSSVHYAPLQAPTTWTLGEAPCYARIVVQK